METKKIGELAELSFYLKAFELNYIVSKPFGDSSRYDFIIDCKGKLSRIQVKSTSKKDGTNRQDRYRVIAARGNKAKKAYTDKDIDFLVAYVIPEKIWYILPVKAIEHNKTLHFYPHRKSGGVYEKYKERWDLFK